MPQRLARLAGPRPGRDPAARPRGTSWRAPSWRSVPTSAAGGPATGSPRRSSSPAAPAPNAPPAISRSAAPDPARFHRWGSFAEFVALGHADVTSSTVPDALGRRRPPPRWAAGSRRRSGPSPTSPRPCRGVGRRARLRRRRALGDRRRVAAGARVVATDPSPAARELAREFGAEAVLDPVRGDPVAEIVDRTGGRRARLVRRRRPGGDLRGLHPLPAPPWPTRADRTAPRRGDPPAVPMDLVIAHELQLLGSHGMAAHDYPRLLALVGSGHFPLPGWYGERCRSTTVHAHSPRSPPRRQRASPCYSPDRSADERPPGEAGVELKHHPGHAEEQTRRS